MGVPGLIEKVQFADLCGTVAKNLSCELSLPKYYYDHYGTHPNSLHYCPLEDIYAVKGPCESVLTMALFFCGKHVDFSDELSAIQCIRSLSCCVPCCRGIAWKCCVANSCLEALGEFPGTVLKSWRAESEWTRHASVIQEIPQLVQELHEYLNIIRLSMDLKYYRVKTHYLSTLKGTKKLSLSKPGIPATCKSTTSFFIKPDPSVALGDVGRLL